jgi:glucokinase
MTTIAALDLGGTHVSAARIDSVTGGVEGLLRRDYRPDDDRQTLLERITGAAAAVADAAVTAAGVSAPGPFDYQRGICTIHGLGKLEALYGVDLRASLAPPLGLDPGAVHFLNDAEAFGLGEVHHGAAEGQARVIALTLGTGLGSSFLVDGAVVREGPGVPPDGSLHLLAFRGAPVEDRLSARGLAARAGAGARELAVEARRGSEEARGALHAFAAELAEFLEPCVRAFAPTCIVVGGSVSRAWDLLHAPLDGAFRDVSVVPAAHVEEAPLLGAAAYAVNTTARP